MNDGSEAIIAQARRLADALGGPAVMEAGQQWIERDARPVARQIVPVATGDLRESIGGTAGPGGVTMYATMPYATDVELGTSQKAARPYLKPAMRQTLNRFGDYLKAALERRK